MPGTYGGPRGVGVSYERGTPVPERERERERTSARETVREKERASERERESVARVLVSE